MPTLPSLFLFKPDIPLKSHDRMPLQTLVVERGFLFFPVRRFRVGKAVFPNLMNDVLALQLINCTFKFLMIKRGLEFGRTD